MNKAMQGAVRGATGTSRVVRTQKERVAESTFRLLDAAVDLLGEQGWAETTAAQIAERAGYSREMVRVRFGSKEGLLAELNRRWEEEILRPPAEGLDGMAGVLSRVASLERLLVDHPRFARAIISYTFQSVGEAERRADLDRWLTELMSATTALIVAGQADGSIRSDVTAPIMARAITDRALGLVLRWLANPTAPLIEDFQAWRESLIQTLASTPGDVLPS